MIHFYFSFASLTTQKQSVWYSNARNFTCNVSLHFDKFVKQKPVAKKIKTRSGWVYWIRFIVKLISTWKQNRYIFADSRVHLMRGYLVNAYDITDARKLFHWFEWATHTRTLTSNLSRFEFFNLFHSILVLMLILLLLAFSSLLFWNLVEIERCYMLRLFTCLPVSLSASMSGWVLAVRCVHVSRCALFALKFSLFRQFLQWNTLNWTFFALNIVLYMKSIGVTWREKRDCDIMFSLFFCVVNSATVKPVDVKGETACLQISNQCVREWMNE